MAPGAEYRLAKAMATASALREYLRSELGDEVDQEILEASVESETDLYELVGRIARDVIQGEKIQEALKQIIRDNQARLSRMSKRTKAMRKAVEGALDGVNTTMRNYPDMSLSLAEGRPALEVEDDKVPAQYKVELVEYVVDRARIIEELEAGNTLDFARFGSPKKILTIRTK
jgi:hypothetical protein